MKKWNYLKYSDPNLQIPFFFALLYRLVKISIDEYE